MRSKSRLLLPLFLLVVALGVPFARAAEALLSDYVKQAVPNAAIVGQGTLTFFMLDVYDATLVAPGGHYDEHKPFALVLNYKRHVDGDQIANTSAAEIKRQGFDDVDRLEEWHQKMRSLFTDVDEGTQLTGVFEPGKPTCFLRNGSLMGCIKDPEFGAYFFRIWLGLDTRAPDLRQGLLGLTQ